MHRQSSLVFRLSRAALVAAVGVLAVGNFATSKAYAQAQAEEEDTFEEGLIRQFMRGMGLKDSRDNGIDYRERAPLVVPPTRDLPPPDSTPVNARNSAWPVDQDVKKRADARARKAKDTRDVNTRLEQEMRPLSQAELNRGRVASRGTPTSSPDPMATDKMSPSQLGYVGGLFDSLWSKVGPAKAEEVPFQREPERATLLAPPAGYQTPSAAHPYGTGVPTDPNSKANALLKDRAAGDVQYPQ